MPRTSPPPSFPAITEPVQLAAASPQSEREVFGRSVAGSLLLWAAFPPIAAVPLVLPALLCWLPLVLSPRPLSRRGYVSLWLAGFLFWAVLLQGIRLAHPALYAGWLTLAAYLGIYLPAFVALSRRLVHVRHLPPWLAVPCVWTGLEYARAHLFTGLSIASLSHAVVEYPLLIQVASLAGAYAVSFLLMLVAITLATWQTSALRTRSEALMATVVTLFCVAGSLAWGWQSLTPQVAKNEGNERSLRVLLVQGSVDTVLDHDPERPRAMLQHYRDLTSEHLATQPEPYDLIVWPESSLAWPDYLSDDTARPRSGSEVTAEEFRENVKAFQNEQRQLISYLLKDFNRLRFGRTEFLAGTTTVVFSGEQARSYNSALLISPFGEVRSRYYKNHLVMFGEYIPVLDWFPWLYDYTPLPGGLHRGDGPVLFMVNGTTCATSICFESTVPHLLRQHFQELSHKGTPPELLLNLSNDGWFYGSAVLDLHFQCAVFRAVECGRPFLVAANTGISGSIDARGRVLARGPRRATALLPVTAKLTKVTTLYTALGDWPVFLLCWGSLLAALPLRFGRTAAEA